MDVGSWLRNLGFEQYEAAFRENGVSYCATIWMRKSDNQGENLLSGNGTPAPDPAQREGPLREKRLAVGSQCGAPRHRNSLAGAFRAPGTDIPVEL